MQHSFINLNIAVTYGKAAINCTRFKRASIFGCLLCVLNVFSGMKSPMTQKMQTFFNNLFNSMI